MDEPSNACFPGLASHSPCSINVDVVELMPVHRGDRTGTMHESRRTVAQLS
jgi:hypothetical protein